MDTTYHSSENVYFEPLKLAGFICYLLEICRNVWFSLWDTSLLWRLRFHWIQDISMKWQHVKLSCLSWSTCWNYVIFLGCVKLIMTFSFHYSRFHAKLWVEKFFFMTSSSWWTLVSCMNIFSKCQFFALLLLQLITMVSRMHSEVRRHCPNKGFPAVQGFTLK